MVLLFHFIIPTILSWEELQELFLPTLTRLQSKPWPLEIVINHPGFLLSPVQLLWLQAGLEISHSVAPEQVPSSPTPTQRKEKKKKRRKKKRKNSPDLKDHTLLLEAVLQALWAPWLSWGSKRNQGPGEGRGGIWVLLAAGEIIH